MCCTKQQTSNSQTSSSLEAPNTMSSFHYSSTHTWRHAHFFDSSRNTKQGTLIREFCKTGIQDVMKGLASCQSMIANGTPTKINAGGRGHPIICPLCPSSWIWQYRRRPSSWVYHCAIYRYVIMPRSAHGQAENAKERSEKNTTFMKSLYLFSPWIIKRHQLSYSRPGLSIRTRLVCMNFLHHCASEMNLSAHRERVMGHERRVVW
jgi:hypothetical protein